MRKKVFCLLICFGAIFGATAQTSEKVEPLYPEKWAEVEQYIHDNWLNFVETHPELPKPYSYALNPGTMYYYDLYFINEALIKQGYHEQARNNLDCFIFSVDSIGFIPNAWGWGDSRSQEPLFGLMVRSFYDETPYKDKAWLKKAYEAVLKEYAFWTNMDGNMIEDHRTPIEGLQRYSHHGDTAELIDFYDRVLFYRFHVSRDVPDALKVSIASQRLAECESMDFTPRYYGHCMDFIPTDLNANMYQYEKNLAYFEKELGIVSDYDWEARATRRAELINRYLWNEERGLYLDFDFVNGKHTPIACIKAFTMMGRGIAPRDREDRLKENLLRALEVESGLTVCEESDEDLPYQFGRTAIWGSMQSIAMTGLCDAGYMDDARRVALKYLNMTTRNYVNPHPATYPPFKYGDGTRHPGRLYEKYTHNGDINDEEYPCSEILGFTAAPYIQALEIVRGASRHPDRGRQVP